MDTASPRLSIAVDIGGTFTDLIAFDAQRGEVRQTRCMTTPHALSPGVWDCLRKAEMAALDFEPGGA